MSDSTDALMPASPITCAIHGSNSALPIISARLGKTSSDRSADPTKEADQSSELPDSRRRKTGFSDAPIPPAEQHEPGQFAQPDGGQEPMPTPSLTNQPHLPPAWWLSSAGHSHPVYGWVTRGYSPRKPNQQKIVLSEEGCGHYAEPLLFGHTPGHAQPRDAWPAICTSRAHATRSPIPPAPHLHVLVMLAFVTIAAGMRCGTLMKTSAIM